MNNMEGPQTKEEFFKGDKWSLPTNVDLVDPAVEAFASRLEGTGWENDNLDLAFNEALVNAMKHGNKFDPNKKVLVTFSVSENEVLIKIKDEGEGFKLEEVPDPLKGEGLIKSSGRGVLLMESFMKVSHIGNEVTLTKTRN